jgi:hypothetical protein
LNQYTKAVKFIQDYVDATNNVFEQGNLPAIETGLEYALKILREQEGYDERTLAQ